MTSYMNSVSRSNSRESYKKKLENYYDLKLYTEGGVSQKEVCSLNHNDVDKLFQRSDLPLIYKFIKIMRLYNKRNSFKNICGIDLSEKKSRKYISKKCYKEKKKNKSYCIEYKEVVGKSIKQINDCHQNLLNNLYKKLINRLNKIRVSINSESSISLEINGDSINKIINNNNKNKCRFFNIVLIATFVRIIKGKNNYKSISIYRNIEKNLLFKLIENVIVDLFYEMKTQYANAKLPFPDNLAATIIKLLTGQISVTHKYEELYIYFSNKKLRKIIVGATDNAFKKFITTISEGKVDTKTSEKKVSQKNSMRNMKKIKEAKKKAKKEMKKRARLSERKISK